MRGQLRRSGGCAGSLPAPVRGCSWSTATRSASARPRPARCRLSWLKAMELMGSLRQTFDELVVHTPFRTCALAPALVLLDIRLPRAVRADVGAGGLDGDSSSRPRPSPAAAAHTVSTDRGELRAPLIVDALGWRRVLSNAPPIQPPNAPLSRGLEVHPPGSGQRDGAVARPELRPLRLRAGASRPATRCGSGVGSFWPAHHVKEPTVRLAREPRPRRRAATRATGSRTSCAARVEDGVFFAGDSAGHCLPLTAEGIRTAIYFGLACGRELRAVLDGSGDPRAGARAYGAFSDAHARKYRWLLGVQRAVGQRDAEPRRHRARDGRSRTARSPRGPSATTWRSPRRPSSRRAAAGSRRAPGTAGAPPPRWPARRGWRSPAPARRGRGAAGVGVARAGRRRPTARRAARTSDSPSTARPSRTTACSPAARPVHGRRPADARRRRRRARRGVHGSGAAPGAGGGRSPRSRAVRASAS